VKSVNLPPPYRWLGALAALAPVRPLCCRIVCQTLGPPPSSARDAAMPAGAEGQELQRHVEGRSPWAGSSGGGATVGSSANSSNFSYGRRAATESSAAALLLLPSEAAAAGSELAIAAAELSTHLLYRTSGHPYVRELALYKGLWY
jgi:hypothetical protein